MGDNHYPRVNTQFIIDKILDSGKVDSASQLRVGSSISFILNGDKALHKRQIILREIDGEINYIQATSFAILCGFMGDLLIWCQENKSWKEGGYFVPHEQAVELEENEEE